MADLDSDGIVEAYGAGPVTPLTLDDKSFNARGSVLEWMQAKLLREAGLHASNVSSALAGVRGLACREVLEVCDGEEERKGKNACGPGGVKPINVCEVGLQVPDVDGLAPFFVGGILQCFRGEKFDVQMARGYVSLVVNRWAVVPSSIAVPVDFGVEFGIPKGVPARVVISDQCGVRQFDRSNLDGPFVELAPAVFCWFDKGAIIVANNALPENGRPWVHVIKKPA